MVLLTKCNQMYPTLATFANCALLLPFLLLHAKRERKLENRLLTLPYFQNHTTSNEGESCSRSAFIIIGWYLLERFFQGLWQHSVRMPNTFTEKRVPHIWHQNIFFRNYHIKCALHFDTIVLLINEYLKYV